MGTAALCVLLWFVYPLLAVWAAERIPLAHLFLLPGGSPTLAALTLILAIATAVLRRLRFFTRWVKVIVIAIGALLTLGWLYVLGYWLLMAVKGGV